MFSKNFPFAICAAALAALTAGPAAAQQAGGDIPKDTAEVLAIVNPMRQAKGIAPLRYAPELAQAAGPDAQKVADQFFGNPVTDQSSPFERVESAGYRSIRVRVLTYLRTAGSPSMQQYLFGTPSLRQTLLDPILTDVGSARLYLSQRTPQGQRDAEATAIIFAARQGATTQPAGGTFTPTPAPAAPAMDEEMVMLAAQLASAINQWRATYRLQPLKPVAELDHAAFAHSQDMAEYSFLGHRGSNGSNYTDRVGDTGYKWQALGELVAHGYRNPDQLAAGWMNSHSGRAQLLSQSYTEIGIGVARQASGTLFWTVVPARPMR